MLFEQCSRILSQWILEAEREALTKEPLKPHHSEPMVVSVDLAFAASSAAALRGVSVGVDRFCRACLTGAACIRLGTCQSTRWL
jgi:hypothetical protein